MNTKTTPQPAPGGLGRGLFASTDIAVGEDVLHLPVPFVAVLDTEHLGEVCSGCFGQRQLEEEGIALKGCRGCGVVKYCDKVRKTALRTFRTPSLTLLADMSSKRLETGPLSRMYHLSEIEASYSTYQRTSRAPHGLAQRTPKVLRRGAESVPAA